LQDGSKRRVAAFGFSAGFCSAALAVKNWVWQTENGDKPLPGVEHITKGRGFFENENQLLVQLKEDLNAGIRKVGKTPTVLVMGALGRCGRGAGLYKFYPC
jgi:saccharopine dehydrogenase (NAD+, L-lysine-forming)